VGASRDPSTVGLALMVGAAVGFGLNPLFARYAYAGGVGPEAAALYRFAVPALALLPFCLAARRHPHAALAVLPVALPALVYFTYPAFTLVLGRILFGERIAPRAAGACACVLLACALILAPGHLTAGQAGALLLCLAAPLAYALLLHGYARWLTPLPVAARTALTLVGATLVLLPVLLLVRGGTGGLLPVAGIGWVGVAGLVTVCSLLPQLVTTLAVPMLGAGAAAVAGSMELVTTLAVGWLALGEAMTAMAAAGGGLILAAQWLGYSRAGPTEPDGDRISN
jgi:drug/metabolite transporter (DMT)-like permease